MRTGMLLLLAAVVLVCAGCAERQGDMTICSTRNVNLAGLANARTGSEPRVEVKDVRHILLIFPVTGSGNLKEAFDKAMDAGKGDTLADVVIYRYWWYVPPLYGQSGWKVKATVLNSAAGGAQAAGWPRRAVEQTPSQIP